MVQNMNNSQIERFSFDLAKESLAFSNIFLKFATQ